MTHFMYCARLNACVVGSNLTVKRGKSDKSVKTINKEKFKKKSKPRYWCGRIRIC